MTINYYSKEVYGNTLYYLADKTQAWTWRNMTGKKTITSSEMAHLTSLTGVTFNRVFEAEA